MIDNKYKYLEDALNDNWFRPVGSNHNRCKGYYDKDFLEIERLEFDKVHLKLKFINVMGYHMPDFYTKMTLYNDDHVYFNFFIENDIDDYGDIPIYKDLNIGDRARYSWGKEWFDFPYNLNEYIDGLQLMYIRYFMWEGRIFNEIFEKNQHLLRNELIDSILND